MSTNANPFEFWSPEDFQASWAKLAPDKLIQPILPWSLNINSNNSTAPQTEVDVLARYSYGRQIGRMSDALRALILEMHPKPPRTGPFADFMTMWKEIEQVKVDSAAARLEQIASDLALLKKKDSEEYRRVRDALLQALDRPE